MRVPPEPASGSVPCVRCPGHCSSPTVDVSDPPVGFDPTPSFHRHSRLGLGTSPRPNGRPYGPSWRWPPAASATPSPTPKPLQPPRCGSAPAGASKYLSPKHSAGRTISQSSLPHRNRPHGVLAWTGEPAKGRVRVLPTPHAWERSRGRALAGPRFESVMHAIAAANGALRPTPNTRRLAWARPAVGEAPSAIPSPATPFQNPFSSRARQSASGDVFGSGAAPRCDTESGTAFPPFLPTTVRCVASVAATRMPPCPM